MANTITLNDIFVGAKFRTNSGIIWIIDEIKGDSVYTSMEHGAKDNYCDDISNVVEFLNSESITKF